jgi:hypothetical protein
VLKVEVVTGTVVRGHHPEISEALIAHRRGEDE